MTYNKHIRNLQWTCNYLSCHGDNGLINFRFILVNNKHIYFGYDHKQIKGLAAG